MYTLICTFPVRVVRENDRFGGWFLKAEDADLEFLVMSLFGSSA